jgi:phosphopantothenoylcysteine synthetase/decarboxylase
MNVLITAGNTAAPIDKVRVITNVFRGRTGARIAGAFAGAGHSVRLLTSSPQTAAADSQAAGGALARIEVIPYATFEELGAAMAVSLREGKYSALIHSAAVSDYLAAGVFAPGAGTEFRDGRWLGDPPTLTDVSAGKVKSDAAELWLRLVRAPKLIDKVRGEWGFRGVVVKFKLEVGVPEPKLLEIAEASRKSSDADLMVANTLEGANEWAYIGPWPQSGEEAARAASAGLGGAATAPTTGYRRIARDRLAAELLAAVMASAAGRGE